MKALAKISATPGIQMIDAEVPTVGPNDALIKIKKTAICGTDIHIEQWDEWAKAHIKTPLIFGHEFVGEVIELGKEVANHFPIGQRVSGEGHIACGHCRNCRAGRSHLCRFNVSVGVTRQGAFAEYIAIPAIQAYPIPDNIPDQLAVILDPLGNATHTALSFNLVGEDVLITGAGPVGLLACAVTRHVGARHIVITDVNEYRLSLARNLGATLAINPKETSLTDVMRTLEMKEGFDVGLEMSGHQQAFKEMIRTMNHAGKIGLLGFLPHETQIDWSTVIMKGLFIKGIYGREMYETWYKMISMLQSGLQIDAVITHEFSIQDFQKGFDIMRTGQSGKVILNWE